MSCWLWKLDYNDHSLPLRIQMIVEPALLHRSLPVLPHSFTLKEYLKYILFATKSYQKIMLQGHGTELHWYKNSEIFFKCLNPRSVHVAVRPENKERVSLSGAFYLGLRKGDKGHCRRIDMLVLIILCKELTSLDVLKLSLLLLSTHHLHYLQT